jgi:hypothetical protein
MSTDFTSVLPLTIKEFSAVAARHGWRHEVTEEGRHRLVSVEEDNFEQPGHRYAWLAEVVDKEGHTRLLLTRYGPNNVRDLIEMRPFYTEQTVAWWDWHDAQNDDADGEEGQP